MSKCIKLLAAIVLLFTIAGCAATDGTMTSSRYGPYDGSYDFGAGDRYSPILPIIIHLDDDLTFEAV